MKKTISGLVAEITSVSHDISFLRILAIPGNGTCEEIPVYGEMDIDYLGKFIAITSKRTGLFGKMFEQKIEGTFHKNLIKWPYHFIEIINNYRPVREYTEKEKIKLS
ncbi:Uncharacterised protein [uncultured archaeon]|nr:Uncharacterised protein [uncultured archaeon]